MKFWSIGFAAAALVSGLVAAYYWYKASNVKVTPKVDGRFGGGMAQASNPSVAGALDAAVENGRLNKIAALWTAGAVVCGGLSSIMGAMSN